MKYSSGNLFLVGLMGAGKTTVGRQLAAQLNKRFVDADRELEARTGVKISVIFEIEGESGFRRRESELLRELTAESNIVLATGGGAIKDGGTRDLLKTRGYTIYLSAGVAELVARLHDDRRRPLLQNKDPRSTLEELLAEREPFYREVADLIVETGRPNIAKLVSGIVAALQSEANTRALLATAESNPQASS
ncbi:MAG: shikimate kinase [Burkholderiaceae bacterium]